MKMIEGDNPITYSDGLVIRRSKRAHLNAFVREQ